MQAYVGLESGHMEYLVQALDGDPEAYAPPDLPPLPTTASPAMAREAIAFLRRRDLHIEPRKMWPPGGLPAFGVAGSIGPEHRAREGRALCVWRDAGWGETVRQGKRDGEFDAELVDAGVRLLERWRPEPNPEWVTCIPSRRHPSLVPDYARRLASALGLPFHLVLEQTEERAEQKLMANSTQQAMNVDGSLNVRREPRSRPVLLVDDIVGSRWTFAVAAWLLRSYGSGEVWPFALALRGARR